MPKTDKKIKRYDLKKYFGTSTGHSYRCSNRLILWGDLKNSPVDKSLVGRALAEVSAPLNGVTTEFDFNFNFVTLDGTNDYVRTVDADDLSFGNGSSDSPFSVSVWIYATSFDSVNMVFAKGDGTSGAAANEYYAWYSSIGTINFKLVDESTGDDITVTSTAQFINGRTNEWIHLGFTYDGSGYSPGAKIYVNGVNVTDPASTISTDAGYTAMEAANGKLYIGAGLAGATPVHGNVAEFALWSKELSQNDVKAIYIATTDGMYEAKGSGIISNPVRHRIRQSDSLPGAYPTILRTGDRDRSGKYHLHFKDENTPVFGKKIEDDFLVTNLNRTSALTNTSTHIDSDKWLVSAGMELRTETIVGEEGASFNNGALVFAGSAGSGAAAGRWIRTKEKLRNPVLSFDLIQGPYNESIVGVGGLDLVQGDLTDVLKIEISTDGTNFIEIERFTPVADLTDLSTIVPTSSITLISLPGAAASIDQKSRIRVKLDMKAFKPVPHDTDYYIRIIQDSVSDDGTSVWDIGKITIIAFDQKINLPTGLQNNSPLEQKAHDTIVASPNIFPSEFNITSRQLSGQSDSNIVFNSINSGENITPFNEALAVEDTRKSFFNVGTSPDIYPGFGSRLQSKTKISFDLSPSEPTTFGMTNRLLAHPTASINDTSGIKQNFMVYWNNITKRWEKIGQGFDFNNHALILGNAIGTSGVLGTVSILVQASGSQELGFGPIGQIFTGSQTEQTHIKADNFNFVSRDQLMTYGRPTTAFGFPSSLKYFASSSQAITARDIGIHHPFLFEKAVIDFDSKFELPVAVGAADMLGEAYGVTAKVHAGRSGIEDNSNLTYHAQKIIQPTFFMMRQFRDRAKVITPFQLFVSGGTVAFTGGYLDEDIPQTSELPHPQNRVGLPYAGKIYHDTNRELITYGQMNLFVSQSNASTLSMPGYTIKNLIDEGLGRDLNIIESYANTIKPAPVSITSSYRMGFKSRTTSPYEGHSTALTFAVTGSEVHIPITNPKGGRKLVEGITYSSRALVAATPGFKKGDDGIIAVPGDASAGVNEVRFNSPAADSIDLDSPYIIMPDDELIFGWQYPITENFGNHSPGVTSGSHGLPSMTLFGNSQLHLYGSLIRDGKALDSTLNQNLTSVAVHEIIGNDPVVDQFETSVRGAYSGSMADRNLVVRSAVNFIFPTPTNGSPWNRLDDGNKLILSMSNPVSRYATSDFYETLYLQATTANSNIVVDNNDASRNSMQQLVRQTKVTVGIGAVDAANSVYDADSTASRYHAAFLSASLGNGHPSAIRVGALRKIPEGGVPGLGKVEYSSVGGFFRAVSGSYFSLYQRYPGARGNTRIVDEGIVFTEFWSAGKYSQDANGDAYQATFDGGGPADGMFTPVEMLTFDNQGLPCTSVSSLEGFSGFPFNRFRKHVDRNRMYRDSMIGNGYLYAIGAIYGRDGRGAYGPDDNDSATNVSNANMWKESSYGTMQTEKYPINPTYAFSIRHFGHYSDMFRQAHDAYSEFQPTAGDLEPINSAIISRPVKILFVTSSVDSTGNTTYYKHEATNASGNRSMFASSSFGFDDSGGDTATVDLSLFLEASPERQVALKTSPVTDTNQLTDKLTRSPVVSPVPISPSTVKKETNTLRETFKKKK